MQPSGLGNNTCFPQEVHGFESGAETTTGLHPVNVVDFVHNKEEIRHAVTGEGPSSVSCVARIPQTGSAAW